MIVCSFVEKSYPPTMLPQEPGSPQLQYASGGEEVSSDAENKKKIDVELKLEATRQFLSDHSRHQQQQQHSRARRASLSMVPPHAPDESLEFRARPQTGRRASMGASPMEAMAAAAVASSSSSRRRASLKGPLTAMASPHDEGDGYGTDSEAANPSKRAQARRASLSLKNQLQCEEQTRRGRRASMSEAVPSYDMDGSEREGDYGGGRPRSSSQELIVTSYAVGTGSGRRASLSGAMARRGSNGVAMDPPLERQRSYGTTMPRRGSNGVSMPRRGSNGVHMPSSSSRRMSGHHLKGLPGAKAQGINPDALARMSRRMSGTAGGYVDPEDDEDADDMDYGYGYGGGGILGVASTHEPRPQYDRRDSHRSQASADPYGYGYGAPVSAGPAPRYERRGSNRSQVSAASSSARSRRRNSYLVRQESDPRIMAEILAGKARVPDSDMEPSSGEESGNNAMYGYSIQNLDTSYDSELDSESERSQTSFSSNARSRRRNSCIIRPDQDPFASLEDDSRHRRSDRDLLGVPDEDDDLNDPDSLLNRSGYFNTIAGVPKKKMAVGASAGRRPSSSMVPPSRSELLPIDDQTPLEIVIPMESSTTSEASGSRVVPPSLSKVQPGWNRAVPFTTSREPLTKEKLEAAAAHCAAPEGAAFHPDQLPGYSLRNNWGDTGLDGMSSSDEMSDDSDASFGASLYADVRPSHQEIDRYHQRARRRDSIEQSWVHMGQLLEESRSRQPEKPKSSAHKRSSATGAVMTAPPSSTKDGNLPRVPNFKPATGCTDASDHVVRCFLARLRAGMTVIKHNRSRWSKSQLRILYVLPDGRTLTWKAMDGEIDKGKRPKLDLSKCLEVRHAWTPDPETRKQLGTSTLRKRCKDGSANKSFSLIFHKRTLDLTALSSDQCRVLMEGFSALAFRLQYDRLNAAKGDDDDGGGNTSSDERRSKDVTGRSYLTDDDWASTVYGGDSTVSMTQSGFSVVPSPAQTVAHPWGL